MTQMTVVVDVVLCCSCPCLGSTGSIVQLN